MSARIFLASLAKAITLADCAGMHDLGDGERAVRLDTADDRLPGLGLPFIGHGGLVDAALGERQIDVNAFGAGRNDSSRLKVGRSVVKWLFLIAAVR